MTKTFHAAIIGVDQYPSFYPNGQLSGCVNDALAIREFLTDRVSVRSENIRLHLSSKNLDTIEGIDSTAVLPANAKDIRATFEHLRKVAKPGAHIVLFYAGHGVRIDRHGTNERIYGFAPADTGFDNATVFSNLIVDQELNATLRALTESGADVTVIMDTCHSANATRAVIGETVNVRRLVPPPLSDAMWAQFIAAHPSLGVSAVPRAATRDGISTAGWFDGSSEERAWVVLAACLDVETAKEDKLDRVPHGLLTACLLRELRKVPSDEIPTLRWMDLFGNLRRAVITRAPALRAGDQTPVLEGRPEKTIFGGAWKAFEPGFVVSKGDTAAEVKIDGGLLDGLDKGAEVRIYPPGTPSFRAADAAGVASMRAQIVSATPAKSTARLLIEGAAPPADGSRARLVKPAPTHARLGVRLTDVPREIESALEGVADFNQFVAINPSAGPIDVEVRPWHKAIPAWDIWKKEADKPAWIGTTGGWVIVPYSSDTKEPTENDVIAYLPPPNAPGVDSGAASIAAGLGQGLVHWARYLHALRLEHIDQGLASFIDVGLCKGEKRDHTTALEPDPSGQYTVTENEPLWIELRAKKTPPNRVFVAFLACSNDGNILLQWPTEGGFPTLAEIGGGESLAPGQTIRVGMDRFNPALPTVRVDQSTSVYTFKVIAAVVPAGETPPALKGFILQDTVQQEVTSEISKKRGGFMMKAISLAPDAWCTWNLPVRVQRIS